MSFKVTTEYDSLRDFPAWSAGEATLNAIIDADRIEEADELAEEMFADETPTDTDVNDWLWFDLPDEMHLYDEENEEGDEAPDMTDEEETPVDDEQGIPVVPRTDDEAVADTDNDPENTNFDVKNDSILEENTKNPAAARSLREDMTDDDETGSLAQVAEAIMDNPEISQYIDGYDSSDGCIDFKLTNGHNVMVYVYDKLSGELGARFDDENGTDLYSYNTACQGAPYGEITDRSVDGITKMLIKDIKKDVEEE